MTDLLGILMLSLSCNTSLNKSGAVLSHVDHPASDSIQTKRVIEPDFLFPAQSKVLFAGPVPAHTEDFSLKGNRAGEIPLKTMKTSPFPVSL